MFTIIISFFVVESAYAEEITIASGTDLPGCEIYNTCYLPSSLTVNENTVVTWKNSDSAMHTVTSGNPSQGPNGQFDSELILADGTFQQVFANSGHYPYYCIIHPWMQGTITVERQQISSSNNYGSISVENTDKEIDYIISNGNIISASLDADVSSVIVEIEGYGDVYLTVILPRDLIDATHGNGQDDDFFVLADGEDVDYNESQATVKHRTLGILLETGIERIEIIGTVVSDENNNDIWFENPSISNSPTTDSYQIRQLQDTISSLNQKLNSVEIKLEQKQKAHDNLKNDYDAMLLDKNGQIRDLNIHLREAEENIRELNMVIMEQIRTIMSLMQK